MTDADDSMSDSNGQALWLSARNIAGVSDELAALGQDLYAMLQHGPIGNLTFAAPGRQVRSGGNWLAWAWSGTLEVFRRRPGQPGRPPKVGDLTILRRIYAATEEEGSNWPFARTPKLFVAFSPFGAWEHQNLLLSGDGTSETTVTAHPYLWHWRSESGGAETTSWFFCVPITSLHADNLREQVVEPLIALINGEAADQAVAFPAGSVACKVPSSTAMANNSA